MTRRWRPSLAFVLGGALAGTLALSLAGLVALRYLGPEIGFRKAALLVGLAIVAATAALGWLLLRLLLRPIRALQRFAIARETGQSDPVPPAHFGTRELHATGQSVIGMAEALHDREATIRSFTDHVVHELKTPVSAIRAATELLAEAPLAPADRHLLAQIDGAQAQIAAQLQALREAARAREARYLGRTTLDAMLPALTAGHPVLTLEATGGAVPLPVSDQGLRVILGHLLRNAEEQGARKVTLTAEMGAGCAVLTVGDDGPGVLPGNAGRIFDPFFTTRRDAGGTGMGLAIVRNILTAHRATIEHLPTQPGATFRIRFGTTATPV